jgi:hypothetical protein
MATNQLNRHFMALCGLLISEYRRAFDLSVRVLITIVKILQLMMYGIILTICYVVIYPLWHLLCPKIIREVRGFNEHGCFIVRVLTYGHELVVSKEEIINTKDKSHYFIQKQVFLQHRNTWKEITDANPMVTYAVIGGQVFHNHLVVYPGIVDGTCYNIDGGFDGFEVMPEFGGRMSYLSRDNIQQNQLLMIDTKSYELNTSNFEHPLNYYKISHRIVSNSWLGWWYGYDARADNTNKQVF